jgi:hypothetical protein
MQLGADLIAASVTVCVSSVDALSTTIISWSRDNDFNASKEARVICKEALLLNVGIMIEIGIEKFRCVQYET